MSGLNPDGLGRTAAFSNSDSDSHSTEQATIGNSRTVSTKSGALATLPTEGLISLWPCQSLNGGSIPDVIGDNDISVPESARLVENGVAGKGVRLPEGEVAKIDPSNTVNGLSGFTLLGISRIETDATGGAGLAVKKNQAEPDTQTEWGIVHSKAGRFGIDSHQLAAFYGDGSNLRQDQGERKISTGPLFQWGLQLSSDSQRTNIIQDGEIESSKTYPTAATDNPDAPIWINAKYNGSGGNDQTSDLTVSWLALYDRELSTAEIQSHQELATWGDAPLRAFDAGAVFPGLFSDPVVEYDSGTFKILRTDNDTGQVDYFETADINNPGSAITNDVLSVGVSSQTAFGFAVDGGTYYVFASDDSGSYRYSGSALDNLTTYDGEVVPDPDGGYLEMDGNSYLVCEDTDSQIGVGSKKLAVYEADSPSGSFSELGTLIDLTSDGLDLPFKTGDPRFFDYNGQKYMTFDVTDNHTYYSSGLARVDTPLSAQILTLSIKDELGGDFYVVDEPDPMIGLSEYYPNGSNGIGAFEIYPH